jgi:hypothetical protein
MKLSKIAKNRFKSIIFPNTIIDTKYIAEPQPSLSMKLYRIEFQFSAVSNTKIVIIEYPKELKLYLNSWFESCGKFPLKNCIPIRA